VITRQEGIGDGTSGGGLVGRALLSSSVLRISVTIRTNALHALPIGLVHPNAISKAAVCGAHTRDDISSTVSCSIVITCG